MWTLTRALFSVLILVLLVAIWCAQPYAWESLRLSFRRAQRIFMAVSYFNKKRKAALSGGPST
jgi:hypothetical protein